VRNGRKLSSDSAHAAGERDSEPACPGTVTIAPAPAAAAAAYDSVQRFVQLVPGVNGAIYCIQADGGLVWYRNTGWQTCNSGCANGGAVVQLGSGWQQFRTVLASENGQLFGFMVDGTVRWYQVRHH
jgi:N,N-dimethylformamidase